MIGVANGLAVKSPAIYSLLRSGGRGVSRSLK
jgi:hypothetical protein